MNFEDKSWESYVKKATDQTYDLTYYAKQLPPLLDLTNLDENATKSDIEQLCQLASKPQHTVAAVCIYPQFVALAREILLGTSVKVATVANFPSGDDSYEQTIDVINKAIIDGAQEIDVVLPYKNYMALDREAALELIHGCRNCCSVRAKLKVILETGELKQPELIARASHDMLEIGADFLKTSTGKVKVNATLEASAIMLQSIREFSQATNKIVGFKAAGGIRKVADAAPYMHLAENIMGSQWINANTFRIGASSLLQDILLYI